MAKENSNPEVQVENEKWQALIFSLSHSWKRFARIGTVGRPSVTTQNITDCE
jgi:hypothetical protein